jgi:pyruvate/2-oxoglutarate dehydrogenase complex dihydrolipoamide dehydrogenase (E3) component
VPGATREVYDQYVEELKKQNRPTDSIRFASAVWYVSDSRGDRAIEGTDLLVATGRKANSDGIGLDKTGVQLKERVYIKTNERLETTAENIWAMGDCAGSPQFTHVGLDDYSIVHANLSAGNRTKSNRLISFCMFTDPELARVGKNEVEARRTASNIGWGSCPWLKCCARKRSPSRAAS